MITKVADAVKVAMERAGITDPADVHYVQTKTPLLTIHTIRDAKSRGKTVWTEQTHESMDLSNGCTALGIAVALGEIEMPTDADVMHDRSLFSVGRVLLLGRRARPGPGRRRRQRAGRRRPLPDRPLGDEGRARPGRHLGRDPRRRPRPARAPAHLRPRRQAGQRLPQVRGVAGRPGPRPPQRDARRLRRALAPPDQGVPSAASPPRSPATRRCSSRSRRPTRAPTAAARSPRSSTWAELAETLRFGVGAFGTSHATLPRGSAKHPTSPGIRRSRPARRGSPRRAAPSVGGARCSARPPENGLSSKRSGEPGSSTSPSVGWSTVEQQPLRQRLLPRVDVVDRRAPCPAGTPASASSASQCSAASVGEDRLDLGDQRVAVRDPVRVGGEAVVGRVQPERRRQRPPQPLRPAGDLHRRRAGREHAVRRDRRVVAPESPGTSPATVHRVPWNACTPTTPASSEVRTTRPRPVRVALVQRRQHAVRAVHAGQQVRDRHADLGRLARSPVTTSARPRPGRSGRSRRASPPARRGRTR